MITPGRYTVSVYKDGTITWPPELTPLMRPPLARITRFEVIDHREDAPEKGRAMVVYGATVELDYQDEDGLGFPRTLKVFLSDH